MGHISKYHQKLQNYKIILLLCLNISVKFKQNIFINLKVI